MKKITRTIATHKITPARVAMEGGELVTYPLDPIEIFNQGITEDKALRLTQKQYGKTNQYVILNIETTETTYGLDFDKFMELAEIIEK